MPPAPPRRRALGAQRHAAGALSTINILTPRRRESRARGVRDYDAVMLALLPLLLGAPLLADARLLNEHPFVMAHDAATTYLDGGVVVHWAKTQGDGGFSKLLNCGARAFDTRPALNKKGALVFHHGSVLIEHDLGDALDEIVSWSNSRGPNATSDDLILLSTWDCAGGDACNAATRTALAERNITLIDDCGALAKLTVDEAFARAALPGGGAALAVWGCLADHYDESVACSGFGSKGQARGAASTAASAAATVGGSGLEYTCYNDSSSKAFPLDRMWDYLGNVSAAGPPADGTLWSHQALWQETDASVAVGVLHGSSLLLDEERSGLNALLAQRLESGAWAASSGLNLVEVNHVCDGGEQLRQAILAH